MIFNVLKKDNFSIGLFIPLILAIGLSFTALGKNFVSYGMAVNLILCLGVLTFQYKAIFTKAKILYFLKAKEIISILFLSSAWLLASVYAINPDVALKEWAQLSGLMFGGLLIYAAMLRYHFDFELFFKITAFALGVFSFLMLAEPWIDGLWDLGMIRYYGSILVIFIPFIWLFIFKNNLGLRQRALWIAGLFIITSAIFASGGRTAWLTLAIILVMFPMFYCWKNVQRPVLKAMIVLSVTFASAVCGLYSYKQNFGEYEYSTRTNAMITMEDPVSGRWDIWINIIPYIQDNLLVGIGIRGIREIQISNSYEIVAHAHNAVLEILLETGIVGLIAFLTVIGVFVFSFLQAYIQNRDPEMKRRAIVIFLSCIAYGISAMAVTSIFHTWWFLYMVILLILLKAAERQLRQQ